MELAVTTAKWHAIKKKYTAADGTTAVRTACGRLILPRKVVEWADKSSLVFWLTPQFEVDLSIRGLCKGCGL